MECEDNDLIEIESVEADDSSEFIDHLSRLVDDQAIAEDDVGDRCFSLLGGKVIFGILLAELPDSFLVALASSLVSDGKEISGKLLTASPVMRLFKYGIAFMTTPELEHKFYYYRHISQLAWKMPGFFNPERMAEIEKTIAAWTSLETLNRLTSPSGSADVAGANPGLPAPYASTTRH